MRARDGAPHKKNIFLYAAENIHRRSEREREGGEGGGSGVGNKGERVEKPYFTAYVVRQLVTCLFPH